MRTTKELAEAIRIALGNGLRYDPVLKSGETLLENMIGEIQNNAYEAGLSLAIHIADSYLQATRSPDAQNIAGLIIEETKAVRDNKDNKRPF